MSYIQFDQLRAFLGWAEDKEKSKFEKAGISNQVKDLRNAVANKRIQSSHIDTLEQILPLVQDDVPVQWQSVFSQTKETIDLTQNSKLQQALRRFADSSSIFLADENSSDEPVEAKVLVPLVEDPRALILPKLPGTNNSVFINGYIPASHQVSLMTPILNESGKPSILIHHVQATTGEKTAVLELSQFFYQEGDTYFFADSNFEEASVWAVSFDSETKTAKKIERYSSYSAAGFVAPIDRTVVVTKMQKEKPHNSYTVKIYTNENEFIKIRIFEDKNGNIQNVSYNDFAHGELEKGPGKIKETLVKGEGRIFAREYYSMPEYGLKLSFKKVRPASGHSAYRVYIYHDLDDVRKNHSRSEKHLQPVQVTQENLSWVDSAESVAQNLKTQLDQKQIDTKGLQQEFYQLRDQFGMQFVAEVIMNLNYDEKHHMHIVNVMRLDDTKNLPMPPDSRIFPGSRDLISGLVSYFSPNTLSGFASQQLLASAQDLYPQIPEKYIEALWLYSQYNTVAESKFLQRGAATPEELEGGHPVGSYRRILSESYTPLSDNQKSREQQRKRVASLLQQDFLTEGFREYLGYQLNIAQNFDLLLLESGNLYYRNQLIHVIGLSEDGQYLKVILDKAHKPLDIPLPKNGSRRDPKEIAIPEESLKRELRMAKLHPDDPFLFSFRERLASKVYGHGGTFYNGNMLMKGSDGIYHVPSSEDVYQSMSGLLELPEDYLAALSRHESSEIRNVEFKKLKPVTYDLEKRGFELAHVNIKKFSKLRMVPYEVVVHGQKMEIFIPAPGSKLTKTLRALGYYVATEEDLPKIVEYYLTHSQSVTTLGFMPERRNIFIMPGLLKRQNDNGGILGFYTWKEEDLVISSEVVGVENNFEKWAAIRLFNTARHEIAHSIKRGNPWITSLIYRAMALDGFSMDYGKTSVEEYFAVLAQHFFDHPIHRRRFPNGYRMLYTLIKLREEGVTWEGPHHDIQVDPVDDPKRARDFDGTYQALRLLATGRDPFEKIRLAKNKSDDDGDGSSGGGQVKPRLAFKPKLKKPDLNRPKVSAEARELIAPSITTKLALSSPQFGKPLVNYGMNPSLMSSMNFTRMI